MTLAGKVIRPTEGVLAREPDVRISLLTTNAAESRTALRAGARDRLAGAALLTSLALATIGWFCLLVLALWKALQWTLVQA